MVYEERESAVMRMVVVGAMDVDDKTSSVGGRGVKILWRKK